MNIRKADLLICLLCWIACLSGRDSSALSPEFENAHHDYIEAFSPDWIQSVSMEFVMLHPCLMDWQKTTFNIQGGRTHRRIHLIQEITGEPTVVSEQGHPPLPYTTRTYIFGGDYVLSDGAGKFDVNGPFVSAMRKVFSYASKYQGDERTSLESYLRRMGYDPDLHNRLAQSEIVGATQEEHELSVSYRVLVNGDPNHPRSGIDTLTYSKEYYPAPLELVSTTLTGEITRRVRYEGWRESAGLHYPSRVTIYMVKRCQDTPAEVITISEAEMNPELNPDLFEFDIEPGMEFQDSRQSPPTIAVWGEHLK